MQSLSDLTSPQIALLDHYVELQSHFRVDEPTDASGRLVTADANADQPFHSWFHFKEAFSSRLADSLLQGEPAPTNFIDPFVGSGTSLISMLDRVSGLPGESTLIGCEVNPFIATVARGKLAGAQLGHSIRGEVERDLEWIRVKLPEALSVRRECPSTTLNNTAYVPAENRDALLALSHLVRSIDPGPSRDILITALGASVEPSSRLRRDGRALRYRAEKIPMDASDQFWLRARRILNDLEMREPVVGARTEVRHASALSERALAPMDGKFNLSIFSPPYPNNIDYTEVYKLEAWVTGMFQTSEEMRHQRLQTLRSHPSIKFPGRHTLDDSVYANDVELLLKPLAEAIPEGRYHLQRERTMRGYLFDMAAIFVELHKAMAIGGRVFCVVANSSHGAGASGFEVASDLLLARAAEIVGFEVECVQIARYPRRRASITGLVRESIIHLRRP